MPWDLKRPVNRLGLPAEVMTTGTLCSITVVICSSILGYIKGMFTPKGSVVLALQFSMASRSCFGYILPAPKTPKPPAFETAEANSAPDVQTIPP